MVVWGAQTRSMDRDASFRCLGSGPPLGCVPLVYPQRRRNFDVGVTHRWGHEAGLATPLGKKASHSMALFGFLESVCATLQVCELKPPASIKLKNVHVDAASVLNDVQGALGMGEGGGWLHARGPAAHRPLAPPEPDPDAPWLALGGGRQPHSIKLATYGTCGAVRGAT